MHTGITISIFKVLRIVLLVAAITAIAAILWTKITRISNRNAYINGNIVLIRARMDGTLSLDNLKLGRILEKGTVIGRIENPRSPPLELQRQSFNQSILLNENEINTITSKLAQREALLKEYTTRQQEQRSLEILYAQQRVVQVEKELAAAKEARENARITKELLADLNKAGTVDRSQADLAASLHLQFVEGVYAKEALLLQTHSQLSAAQQGLQLDGSKSPSYFAVRSETLLPEIADLKGQLANAEVRLKQDKIALGKVAEEYEVEKFTELTVPVTGVVWSQKARAGEYVREGETILQILDSSKLWVETFVSEEDAAKLYVGAPAQVRLASHDSDKEWNVTVETIRGGSGRVQVGELVTVPPPELIRREVAVRLGMNWKDGPIKSLGAEQFYGAGRTVEVTFEDSHGTR